MSLVGPRPCLAYETEHFAPHHYERFLAPAGHHRPLAGDGAGARQLRRGARDGRRLRSRLVARTRSVPDPPHAGRGAATAEVDGLMTPGRITVIGALVEDVVSERGDRCASGWSGSGTGGRTWCATSTSRARRRPPGCAICARSCSTSSGAGSRPSARPATSTRCSTIRQPGCGRRRHPRLHPPRPGDAGARTRASTSSSRSRSRRRRTMAIDLIRAADERGLVLDAGPHVPVQPAGQPHSRPDPLRGARGDLLHLDVPSQSRPAPVRRERDLGSRAARLLDPAVLAGGAAEPGRHHGPRLHRGREGGRGVHQLRVRLRARSPTSSCPGSRPASSAGRRSSGRRRWSSTTTAATNRCASTTRASCRAIPSPSASTSSTARATSCRRTSRAASRSRSRWRTSAAQSAPARRPAPSAQLGLDVVRMIEAAERSHIHNGRSGLVHRQASVADV